MGLISGLLCRLTHSTWPPVHLVCVIFLQVWVGFSGGDDKVHVQMMWGVTSLSKGIGVMSHEIWHWTQECFDPLQMHMNCRLWENSIHNYTCSYYQAHCIVLCDYPWLKWLNDKGEVEPRYGVIAESWRITSSYREIHCTCAYSGHALRLWIRKPWRYFWTLETAGEWFRSWSWRDRFATDKCDQGGYLGMHDGSLRGLRL